jgi:hypothetical protein
MLSSRKFNRLRASYFSLSWKKLQKFFNLKKLNLQKYIYGLFVFKFD